MLTQILTWWSRHMVELLPARFRGNAARPADGMVAELQPPTIAGSPELRLIARRKRHETDLGRFAVDAFGMRALRAALDQRKMRRPAVLLRLAADAVLERDVTLPLAAEPELERVLSYGMDRYTPFTADGVFWTWSIANRDAARGRLLVRLSVVPKSVLQPLLDALAGVGIGAVGLEAAARSGPARRISLQARDAARSGWSRRAAAGLAIACVMLAVAAASLPFALQAIARNGVEERLAAIQPRLAQAEALRRAISARDAGVDIFVAERGRVGNTLRVLASVTDLLPDDTFLSELTLRGGKLELTGQSGSAPLLIAALSADPVIRNPAFASAVTRQDSRLDQFSIRAEIAP